MRTLYILDGEIMRDSVEWTKDTLVAPKSQNFGAMVFVRSENACDLYVGIENIYGKV